MGLHEPEKWFGSYQLCKVDTSFTLPVELMYFEVYSFSYFLIVKRTKKPQSTVKTSKKKPAISAMD